MLKFEKMTKIEPALLCVSEEIRAFQERISVPRTMFLDDPAVLTSEEMLRQLEKRRMGVHWDEREKKYRIFRNSEIWTTYRNWSKTHGPLPKIPVEIYSRPTKKEREKWAGSDLVMDPLCMSFDRDQLKNVVKILFYDPSFKVDHYILCDSVRNFLRACGRNPNYASDLSKLIKNQIANTQSLLSVDTKDLDVKKDYSSKHSFSSELYTKKGHKK